MWSPHLVTEMISSCSPGCLVFWFALLLWPHGPVPVECTWQQGSACSSPQRESFQPPPPARVGRGLFVGGPDRVEELPFLLLVRVLFLSWKAAALARPLPPALHSGGLLPCDLFCLQCICVSLLSLWAVSPECCPSPCPLQTLGIPPRRSASVAVRCGLRYLLCLMNS